MDADLPRLLLGPLLRYIDQHDATIWVETDRPCTVRVAGHEADTWSVHGRHYALVQILGLEAGSVTEYTVELDGARVWPEPDTPFPPSVIRTYSDQDSFRLSFGSCRRSAGDDPASLRALGADALVGLANQMMDNLDHHAWPDALFMAGDQIYADEPSPEQRAQLLAERGIEDPENLPADHPYAGVAGEIQNFDEYARLYHDSWGRPHVRWLLSTVPTMMILDDHDLRDDWNTSDTWRSQVTDKAWWQERIIGAFGSYWVYQHLGNLSPADLAAHETYRAILAAPTDAERSTILDELAARTDTQPETGQWSFSRDLGTKNLAIRFVAIDSRCSRQLGAGHRRMVDDAEWAWISEAMDPPGERLDHLLVGTSLPVLLLPGIHHLEGWNEAVADGAWGRAAAEFAEWLRQAVDLEHWSAFRASFDDLFALIGQVGQRPDPPSTILLLSGDVHASYIASAWAPGIDRARTALHQLVMSPFRNPLHRPIRFANTLLVKPGVTRLLRRLARTARVLPGPASWRLSHGVWFDNGIMTLVIRGRHVMAEVDHALVVKGRQVLRRRCNAPLSRPNAAWPHDVMPVPATTNAPATDNAPAPSNA